MHWPMRSRSRRWSKIAEKSIQIDKRRGVQGHTVQAKTFWFVLVNLKSYVSKEELHKARTLDYGFSICIPHAMLWGLMLSNWVGSLKWSDAQKRKKKKGINVKDDEFKGFSRHIEWWYNKHGEWRFCLEKPRMVTQLHTLLLWRPFAAGRLWTPRDDEPISSLSHVADFPAEWFRLYRCPRLPRQADFWHSGFILLKSRMWHWTFTPEQGFFFFF